MKFQLKFVMIFLGSICYLANLSLSKATLVLTMSDPKSKCEKLLLSMCLNRNFKDPTSPPKIFKLSQVSLTKLFNKYESSFLSKIKEALDGEISPGKTKNSMGKLLVKSFPNQCTIAYTPECIERLTQKEKPIQSKSSQCVDAEAQRDLCYKKLAPLVYKMMVVRNVPTKQYFNPIAIFKPLKKFSLRAHNVSRKQLNKLYKKNYFYNRLTNDLAAKIIAEIYPNEYAERVEDVLFPEAKRLIIKKIKSLDLSSKHEKVLLAKLEKVQYAGIDKYCHRRSSNSDRTLSSAFKFNAYYRSKGTGLSPDNSFRLCLGALFKSNSDAVIHTMAHEIGHSIDPCNMLTKPEKITLQNIKDRLGLDHYNKYISSVYPLSSLVSCLRDSNSVRAHLFPGGSSHSHWADSIVTTYKTNKDRHTDLCTKDQISESVSDWLAAETLGSYFEEKLKNLNQQEIFKFLTNSSHNFCRFNEANKIAADEVHPKYESRVNRILLRNPKIRKALGCSTENIDSGYCDGKSEKPIFDLEADPLGNQSGKENTIF